MRAPDAASAQKPGIQAPAARELGKGFLLFKTSRAQSQEALADLSIELRSLPPAFEPLFATVPNGKESTRGKVAERVEPPQGGGSER